MSAYLNPLTRIELDVLTADAEHANARAQTVLRCLPLGDPERLAAVCGVAQDCMGWLMDCYDQSWLRWAAEFDRVFDLAGDNDPTEWRP